MMDVTFFGRVATVAMLGLDYRRLENRMRRVCFGEEGDGKSTSDMRATGGAGQVGVMEMNLLVDNFRWYRPGTRHRTQKLRFSFLLIFRFVCQVGRYESPTITYSCYVRWVLGLALSHVTYIKPNQPIT